MAAEDEPVDVMPGTGRQVLGPRRRLLGAMRTADLTDAGDLPREQRDHFLFLLVLWPKARERSAARWSGSPQRGSLVHSGMESRKACA